MKDAFAMFDFEPRPLVNLHQLQEKYFHYAALLHPDHSGGDAHAFAELGRARALLENPAERLYHLIELQGESGLGATKDTTSSFTTEIREMMDLTSLLFEVKEQISRMQKSFTPLAQAAHIQPSKEYLAQLEQAKTRIHEILERLNDEIRVMDQLWPRISLSQIAQLAHFLRLVQKKETQVSESLFQLKSSLRVFSPIFSN